MKRRQGSTTLRCVIYQKSGDRMIFAVEAWNHAKYVLFCEIFEEESYCLSPKTYLD